MRRVKEKTEKVVFKLNIQKMKIMESGPITSWKIDAKLWQTLFFRGSKITADGDCRHEIKRHLFLGRKVMSKLDSIFKKQRHHLANNGSHSQSYSFSSSHVRVGP